VGRSRLVVIDADLPRRLAHRLNERKRDAVSAYDLGLDDLQDPDLLRELAKRYNGLRTWVLVTGDDSMPAEHGSVIIETQATIATLHPKYPPQMTEHHWRVDLVQRWVHAMQLQAPETVRRYALNGSLPWRPRRRQARQIAHHGWTSWSEVNAREERRQRAQPADPPGPGEAPDTQERFPGLA